MFDTLYPCNNILALSALQLKFFKQLLQMLMKPITDETTLTNSRNSFNMNVYHDPKLVAYTCFNSIHPSTRILACKL